MTTDIPLETAPPRRGVVRRLLANPLAIVAVVIFAIIVLASVFAPLLAPHDPNAVVLSIARTPPSAAHIMGGDGAGRDVFSRLLFGGRITIVGALIATVVAMIVGIPSGLFAGFYGRWFDGLSSWVSNMIMAIPGMIILLAVIAAIGPSTYLIMAVFGILLSPSFFRLVRTAVIAVKNELYVDAARVSGLSDARIIGRHIFAVVRAPIVIQASISAGIAVLLQTGIQFLGLGEQDVASWGQMLADAFNNIYAAPYLVVWPGVTTAILVLALALFGNALRDALQDEEKTPRRRSPRSPAARRTAAPPAPEQDASPSALVSVTNLTIGYPRSSDDPGTVVREVSLHVERGEVLGLVGESGSGKTQTAFAILGLLPESADIQGGSIVFDGVELVRARPSLRRATRGKRIAYIPQEPMSNLDPSFTIGSQLVEPMRRLLSLSRSEARSRAIGLLDRVGIANPTRTFDSYPHEISGGMAQRVLIAGAVSCDPELLIADEPTTALDVTVQAEVLDLLRDLQRERHMALLIVTHNFGVVADLCDRVAVMQSGRIVETNDVAAIFAAPRHPYTRMLLDSTLENASLREPLHTIESKA